MTQLLDALCKILDYHNFVALYPNTEPTTYIAVVISLAILLTIIVKKLIRYLKGMKKID